MTDSIITDPAVRAAAQTHYDEIMGEIEPDLTSENIRRLPELYKNESPAEAQARAKRYQRAFARFHEVMESHKAEISSHMKQMEREARISTEAMERDIEEMDLTELDSAIAAA